MATSNARTARKTAASSKTTARPARKKAAAAPAGRAAKPTTPAAGATELSTATHSAKAPQQLPAEPKKVKLVRDSFTLPKVEYGVIAILKTRAARLAHPAKKSEIVRAGLKALVTMSDADFLGCVSSLPPAKPKASAKT